MIRFQRRAIMISQVILMLPLISAIVMMTYELAVTSARVQGRERQLVSDEATMRDLARRIRRDARQATGAHVDEYAEGTKLMLICRGYTVTYQACGGNVVRAEEHENEPGMRYVWTLLGRQARFQNERIGPMGDLIWTTFTTRAAAHRSPVPQQQLSFSAAVGQGGGS